MILDKIIKYKKQQVLLLKRKKPLKELKREVALLGKKNPLFLKALRSAKSLAVIAEIKRKSPSKGMLRKRFDPEGLGKSLERGGATALSVLTDEKFFGGSGEILKRVKAITRLPILRKDFIVDEYQVWESRLLGADAVLLIAAILSEEKIKKYLKLARSLGLAALLEVHTARDVRKALKSRATLVGINNRDLRTFGTDLRTTRRFVRYFPKSVFIVSESGIQSRKDLIYLKACGARAVLVGESLMKQKDPAQALKELLGR